ncbi:MAG TPA: nucleotidyltransferase domain-containing protein [Anaerolineae bacterium]
MHLHHHESIERVRAFFEAISSVQALLLGGSLAHGFESNTSDVDIMIIVDEDEYQERLKTEQVAFYNRELCTYPEGYVDGKYLSIEFLRKVAQQGSEPARFAFAGSQVLFARVEGLPALLQQIVRYPLEQKLYRITRFNAQFEAWNWYAHEALRLNNRYLLGVSVQKLALFGGRMVLAHNELLYPYHKWFLRVLDGAPDKPADLAARLREMIDQPGEKTVTAFYECVRNHRKWETAETGWPNLFELDSELNWLHGTTPVDDL